MCIPPDKVKNMVTDSSTEQKDMECDTDKRIGVTNDSKSNRDLDSNENIKDNVEKMNIETGEDLNKKMNGVSVSDSDVEVKTDSVSERQNSIDNTEIEGSKKGDVSLAQSTNHDLKNAESKIDGVSDDNSVDVRTENVKTGDEKDMEKVKRVNDSKLEKEVLNAAELQELHEKADILHFLLPALCHLTAEEAPRHILLNCGGLGVLDLYMWRQWEKLVAHENLRETVVSFLTIYF